MNNKIKNFLTDNEWTFENIDGINTYTMPGNIGINVMNEYIVFIGKYDLKHIAINDDSIYTLIGYMLENKFISISYNSPR